MAWQRRKVKKKSHYDFGFFWALIELYRLVKYRIVAKSQTINLVDREPSINDAGIFSEF